MKVRSLLARSVAIAVLASLIVILAASSAFAVLPSQLPLKVTANGQTFDVPGNMAMSIAASSSVVDTPNVQTWIAVTVAPAVKSNPVSASYSTYAYTKSHKGLRIVHAQYGFALNQSASVALLCSKIASITTSTNTTTTIALVGTSTKPAKLDSQLGKIIVEKLSKRRFWLYSNGKLEKTYRNAIGQPAWPTPTGNFHIGKKVKLPSWRNGYAAWSMSMPAYIGPGPNNPLGTRALYVYNSKGQDTGVRFHGVPHSEDYSIGKALSHGCLRMHRKDVEDFFPRVKVGTPVYIIKG